MEENYNNPNQQNWQQPQQPQQNWNNQPPQPQQNWNNQQYNPQFNNQPQKESSAPMVLGIVSIVMDIICCGGGFIPGIIGLILGVTNKGKNPNDSKAKLGITLSIIGLAIAVVIGIVALILNVTGVWEELAYELT